MKNRPSHRSFAYVFPVVAALLVLNGCFNSAPRWSERLAWLDGLLDLKTINALNPAFFDLFQRRSLQSQRPDSNR